MAGMAMMQRRTLFLAGTAVGRLSFQAILLARFGRARTTANLASTNIVAIARAVAIPDIPASTAMTIILLTVAINLI
jgi:hypothetical protein